MLEAPHFHSRARVRPLTVALLAGGTSAERDVSLESGRAVRTALESRGHHVTWIDPADVDLGAYDFSSFDAAFIALHGSFGEDGAVQVILDQAHVPYTGSNAAASRLAFNKSATKERLIQCGVPTPPYVLVHKTDDVGRIERQARALGYPLAVKPNSQGSSLGISIIDQASELPPALEDCFAFDPFGLVEKGVVGSEWTVGLIDNQVLPPIRIETQRPFYDYQAKYEDSATTYHFEADRGEWGDVSRRVSEIGRRAAEAVGTRGLARVDLRVDQRGTAWVLEINTIPGMTSHSLIPKAAERADMVFEELCERALRGCLSEAGLEAGANIVPTKAV